MIYENVQRYAYVIMFINIALLVLNASGAFPIADTLDMKTYQKMESISISMNTIDSKFSGYSGISDVLSIAGTMITEGVKIVVNIIIMVAYGPAEIFKLFMIPFVIYAPMVVGINVVILYDFGKLLLKAV